MLAYVTGMITAFVLARILVFQNSQRTLHHSALYFILVNAVAVLQTWVISLLLLYQVLPYLGVNYLSEEIAHGVGVMIPVFTSYLGHKFLTFKE